MNPSIENNYRVDLSVMNAIMVPYGLTFNLYGPSVDDLLETISGPPYSDDNHTLQC